MSTLATELRNKLERVVIDARDEAEAGARAAIQTIAVHHHEPYPHMTPGQRELRNHLRARARQLGDRQDSSGLLAIDHLVAECAYEHWHRMLFARFLAENSLLIEPGENTAISLAEAEELAKDDGLNVWVFVSHCAQRMLPQIFRPDDPLLHVSFAIEHMLKLEKLLASLPQAVFIASDALGWVYQFWQSKKKDEVNRSGIKIGADEIAAVTQLFTEPYMVRFLLHNTLGAWWAGKRLTANDAASANTEDELRRKLALPGVGWEYLRFVRGVDGKGGQWRPAAGTFDGWPKNAAELKLLDPCGGSGHFLVAALHHLVPMRMVEEGLSATKAIDAVLRDNLHGLEIDERCCQIAAFALALAAWTYPDAGRYRALPALHIACTGMGPQSTEEQWVRLAEQSGLPTRADERERIKNGLLNLHRLFSQAPILGSLISPAWLAGDLIAADYKTIQPYLDAILKVEKADDETRERAIAAQGMVRAAEMLADDYTLVITNVPYLGHRKQSKRERPQDPEGLADYSARVHPNAKADLATCFVERCLEFCARDGTIALVSPQNWLFLTTYTKLRNTALTWREWNFVARLGPGAFETITGHIVNVAILAISASKPTDDHLMAGIDVSSVTKSFEKAAMLKGSKPATITIIEQAEQLKRPDARISFEETGSESYLSNFADGLAGILNGDSPHYLKVFWEVFERHELWSFQQTTQEETSSFGGLHNLVYFDEMGGHLREEEWIRKERLHNSDQRGQSALHKKGVAVSSMGRLPVSQFLGSRFDSNVAAVIPNNEDQLPAIWCFCASPEFHDAVRAIDRSLKVTNSTLVKVPFNLEHWQKVATERYPNGLPEPESDDPTQWLFHGLPKESTAPLQVAVARLLGYRWPAELDDKMHLSSRARALVERCDELAKFATAGGIVCIPSVRGEEPASELLLTMLVASGVKGDNVSELVREGDLDEWLRDAFFEEHCKLFHNRPFVWHIWDGRKRDGFHALVNYHGLCEGGGKGRKLLESLAYSYLGEWITRQKDGVRRGEGGAEDRLAAALELQKRLEAILKGEPPFDIFVRWKPLSQQAIGWDPDINDGVRMNIRPFLVSGLSNGRGGAGVLRWKPNIKWDKDRGKEPERPKGAYPWFWNWDGKAEDFMGGGEFDGNRHNDCHYTNKAKQAARDAAGKGKS